MVVYFSFILLSLVWLFILLVGPYLQAHGLENNNNIIVTLYYSLFKLICHQLPERSYFIWGYQMPVCIRCLGIYLGIPIGSVIYPFFRKINSIKLPNPKLLLIFFIPIIIDGIAQTLNLYPSPHYIRLLTGIWASGGLVFWALPMLNQFYKKLRN
ncbi:MAG: DUF2085 domain-containing protein [Candidatus Gastranaerophilales bacterium]|nr:DUF2085 domain-containing protein [Candidatus Gastranaerophilales bacterium]